MNSCFEKQPLSSVPLGNTVGAGLNGHPVYSWLCLATVMPNGINLNCETGFQGHGESRGEQRIGPPLTPGSLGRALLSCDRRMEVKCQLKLFTSRQTRHYQLLNKSRESYGTCDLSVKAKSFKPLVSLQTELVPAQKATGANSPIAELDIKQLFFHFPVREHLLQVNFVLPLFRYCVSPES